MGTGAQLAMLPWFVRDYIAATRHLSLAERGAYTDLLFLSWEIGPLPADPARLARLVGCGAEEFAQVWPGISDKFTPAADESGLINARLEEHRAESRRRSQTARQKAEKRWHADTSDLFGDAPADAAAHAPADAAADARGSHPAYARSMLPSPSPSPSPEPSPESDTSRPKDAARPKRSYQTKAFHDLVIAAYHEALPELPAVKIWSNARAQFLNARIRESCARGKAADTVEYWRTLFGKAAKNDHWCGRKVDSTWCASLEWFLRPTNFAKVIEWEPRGRGNGAHHGR